MIKTLADRHTQELFATGRVKKVPADIPKRATRKLEYIDLATDIDRLRFPPGSRLHELERDRRGQRSISINDQWRICFQRIKPLKVA